MGRGVLEPKDGAKSPREEHAFDACEGNVAPRQLSAPVAYTLTPPGTDLLCAGSMLLLLPPEFPFKWRYRLERNQ